MSNIQKRFEDSLEQMVRNHLKGNRTKKLWELYPPQDWKVIMTKLRLVLSWVMGRKVLTMTDVVVMSHIMKEYKKYNHDGYLTKKYGEYYVW